MKERKKKKKGTKRNKRSEQKEVQTPEKREREMCNTFISFVFPPKLMHVCMCTKAITHSSGTAPLPIFSPDTLGNKSNTACVSSSALEHTHARNHSLTHSFTLSLTHSLSQALVEQAGAACWSLQFESLFIQNRQQQCGTKSTRKAEQTMVTKTIKATGEENKARLSSSQPQHTHTHRHTQIPVRHCASQGP